MVRVGQRRSGSHPRSAPIPPAIADKVRSYGEKHRAFRQPVGAGPARDFARRARSYIGMVRVGQRSGSHPRSAPIPPAIADKVRSYGEKHRASRQPGAGPTRDFARRARSYIGMVRVGQRKSGSHPRSAPIPPAIADKVRSYGEKHRASRQPVGAGPARDFARRAREGCSPVMSVYWLGSFPLSPTLSLKGEGACPRREK